MKIHHKDITESTNIDARAGVHGDVFTADYQTAGRGRLDHRWESDKGLNVMFSAVMDVSSVELSEAVTLPLMIGVAVTTALKRMYPSLDGRLALKWPNDVLVGGRKIAGILCERNGDTVIAGVGLNVNQRSFPGDIAGRATSLAVIFGDDIDRNAVLKTVLESLYAQYERWVKGGFCALHGEYSAIDGLKGKNVTVRQTDTDASPVSGYCEGVQTDGTLLVAGTKIYAGEAHILCLQDTESNISP